MKHLHLLILMVLFAFTSFSQEERRRPLSVFASTGLVNYQGDLMPNSFDFSNSNPYITLGIHQPITGRIAFKGGVSKGAIEAADRNNRGYLIPRNLSFRTNIKEAFGGFEFSFFNLDNSRFTPFLYLGAAVFKFNPYAIDKNGEKVYLQPLSTEGQGLEGYADRQPYKLTQTAICYGAGFKLKINEDVLVGWELNHRKTFTDYLDDVSRSYVDREKLLAAKGQKAVEMAYRGYEVPSGSPSYPHDGEQRGTPTESDWYYYFGMSVQVKLSSVKQSVRKVLVNEKSVYLKRCPTVF